MAHSGSAYDIDWNPGAKRPPQAVGWDLDSTLCSTMHRRYLIPEIRAGRATWDDYSDLCVDDTPIGGAVVLARMLWRAGHTQYAISGRSARAKDRTLRWMAKHDVPMDHVILQPEGDQTENGLFKVQQLNELRYRGVEFCLFIEDWGPAAKYIAEQTGVPVLGVNPFDEGSTLVTREQLAEALRESDGFEYGELKVSIDSLAERVFAELGGSF